jgi:hypothetical protein
MWRGSGISLKGGTHINSRFSRDLFPHIHRFVSLVMAKGVVGSGQYAWYRLQDEYRLWRLGIREAMRQTLVNLSDEQLGYCQTSCHAHDPSESFYAFREAMRRFVRPGPSDVLLDYGSGMGRVLLMAATFPFRRIIGVEYSEGLNRAASRIIGSVECRLRCKDVSLVTANAAEYVLPHDVTVLYFFNPFGGDILTRVCQRIRDSIREAPRAIKIVYYTHGHFERLITNCGWITKRGELFLPAVCRYKIGLYETVT